MEITEIIDHYFQAWNAHDAAALAALFASPTAVVYEDPTTRVAIRAEDMETVVRSMAAGFPDFRFRITSQVIDGPRAIVEWVLNGTNTVAIKAGIVATGKSLHLVGVDVLEAGSPRGMTRARRYFDQKSMYEQIGMQAIIEPISQGAATFGYSKRAASGNLAMPRVLAATWIAFRDQSELNRIREHAAEIIQNFLDEPGFISIVTGAAGNRAFTVTAWEDEDALKRGLAKAHLSAKHEFQTSDLSPGVWTSIWAPHRINRLWTKCGRCGQPNDQTNNRTDCGFCGSPLVERQPYW
jgi:steroid delta-isomerase-like uncharacterized protein